MANPLVAEDVSKLSFSHSRPYSYAHPRTTMLMFGPKNAPGTQVQYLYLPHDLKGGAAGGDTLQSVRPRRGIILNITQFDGIPMADVFKVLQYWSFSCSPTDPNKTVVRVGLAMHYIKSSLFKSQIFGGTKDELSDQLKKWYLFIERRVSEYRERLALEKDELGLDYENEEEQEEEEEDEYGMYENSNNIEGSSEGLTVQTEPGQGTTATRRKSFEEGAAPSRPMSRRLSRDSRMGTPLASSSAANMSHTPTAVPATVSLASAEPAVHVKDTSKTILVGVLLLFFVLILIQWSYNRSLARQITVLNAKFDLSQQKSEEFMRETQEAVQRLLKHLNVK